MSNANETKTTTSSTKTKVAVGVAVAATAVTAVVFWKVPAAREAAGQLIKKIMRTE